MKNWSDLVKLMYFVLICIYSNTEAAPTSNENNEVPAFRIITMENNNKEVNSNDGMYENMAQGLDNIDKAMEAMIDNYLAETEYFAQNNVAENQNMNFKKVQIEQPMMTGIRSINPKYVINMPLSDTEREVQAKGPFSSISNVLPGGETTTSTTTTAAPYNPSSILGGIPGGLGGIPGGIGGSNDKQQGSTIILGGFSAMLIPTRGMDMSQLMSMISTGQQLSQYLPKPSGS
ncbi:uncharacterized protein LOC126894063 isoform X1 [Daktulosphaira vitifoliae]|uniref:uncharacterized protein LOC126894063 isoform X1 n=1 Tax=Daktulosphaira vitifoliae TaxID=58002 RepID=UPI0021AA93CD|nr:uncharacterized protein LOC126894063 isoform X1 [Daktulosphaira vitifoliae]